MPTITNTKGELVDLATGEVVGRQEGAPAPSTDMRKAGPDQGPSSLWEKAQQLSWGFNSALFALPDMFSRNVGKVIGLDEGQAFEFGRFFNQGQQTPKNAADRYSRAIGEGIGASMPFTGILAWAAASRPLVNAAPKATTLFKGIADDAISMVQKSPAVAAAVDVAFGAGYESLRQAVEEQVDEANPNKQLYKELLPMGAFLGIPLAVSKLPSVQAAGWARNKIASASGGLDDIEKEVLAGLPRGFRLPVVDILPKQFIKNAERKLEQVFGPINQSPEAQEALRQLQAAMADPRVAQAGFLFDAAEQSMYAPLVRRKAELLEQLGPKELEATKARINENQQKLDALFDSFSPAAKKPIVEAFQQAQAERQALFESLLRQQKDLTDAEVMAISERLGPQNIDQLNNELRGVLMNTMEIDAQQRNQILRRMGLRQAVSPEGLPMATREEGKSLFPSQDMEDAAIKLIQKYTPERPTGRLVLPTPIALLKGFVDSRLALRQRMETQMMDQLVDQRIREQLEGSSLLQDAEFMKSLKSEVMAAIRGAGSKGPKRKVQARELFKGAEGEVRIPVAGGRAIEINPKTLAEDAARLAEANTKIDINLPEAMDYLQSAIRYRNDSLARYNAAMDRGRVRITDAQRFLDAGNATFRDVEKLILDHVPRIRNEYGNMKAVIDDYRAGFERSLPLLMTKKVRGGEEFLLPNERLLQTAFSNAQNLRDLQVALAGVPAGEELLQKGALDWLRSKGVVTAEGLVDPKKIRTVLDKNRNIVEVLPQNVQQMFRDEVALADDYIRRMGEIEQRRVTAQDNELDRLLSRAARTDADPRQILNSALRDPATMRVLVNQLGKDPEQLGALRRAVFDVATEGARGGGAIKTFIDNNEKSLRVLFENTQHLDDLKKLADLQRRVNAFADVTGQIPAFESVDESIKRLFGSGIQYLTTTFREAAVGRIAPETGALALLVRMAGNLENEVYKRIFTRALEDPEFARRITQVGTVQQAKQVAAQLQKIGISPSAYVPKAARTTAQEIADFAKADETLQDNVPSVPSSAAQMLRTLPPAPPTRGLNLRVPETVAPAQAGPPQVNLMYPALFPNDPISALLQARQTQIQQGQPVR